MSKSLDQRYESAATLAAELRSVGAILDVRSDTQEAASVFVPTRPARRSMGGWIVLLLLLAALAAAAWYERGAIERMWRGAMSPAPAVPVSRVTEQPAVVVSRRELVHLAAATSRPSPPSAPYAAVIVSPPARCGSRAWDAAVSAEA